MPIDRQEISFISTNWPLTAGCRFHFLNGLAAPASLHREVRIGELELMPSFSAMRRTGAYSFLSRLPRTMPWPSAPLRQPRVAAYLAKADLGPQHSVHSRPWQREVVIQESREGFIVHQEIPQRQTCREIVFYFHLISNSKKKNMSAQWGEWRKPRFKPMDNHRLLA